MKEYQIMFYSIKTRTQKARKTWEKMKRACKIGTEMIPYNMK
jgi:hypothetical protein